MPWVSARQDGRVTRVGREEVPGAVLVESIPPTPPFTIDEERPVATLSGGEVTWSLEPIPVADLFDRPAEVRLAKILGLLDPQDRADREAQVVARLTAMADDLRTIAESASELSAAQVRAAVGKVATAARLLAKLELRDLDDAQ